MHKGYYYGYYITNIIMSKYLIIWLGVIVKAQYMVKEDLKLWRHMFQQHPMVISFFNLSNLLLKTEQNRIDFWIISQQTTIYSFSIHFLYYMKTELIDLSDQTALLQSVYKDHAMLLNSRGSLPYLWFSAMVADQQQIPPTCKIMTISHHGDPFPRKKIEW